LTISSDAQYCYQPMATDILRAVSLVDRDVEREAQELRELRAALGLKQIDVARMADVLPGTISEWERGVRECQYAVLQLLRCMARERSQAASAAAERPRARRVK
jgi:DNA-binding transcriptional regulator YiaG